MLQRKIQDDAEEGLRAHDALRVNTLRMLLSAIHNREIEKRSKSGSGELTDEEIIEVLQKEAKKRREAADIYMKASRAELAEKEAKELELIQSYLPKSMEEKEIEAVVDKVVANGTKDFGLVMKAVMAEVKGKAEAGIVSGIVKKKLGE